MLTNCELQLQSAEAEAEAVATSMSMRTVCVATGGTLIINKERKMSNVVRVIIS